MPALAAMTGQAVTAKGCDGRHRAIGVDPDDARADAADHPVRAGQAAGEDARGEAKLGVVGQRQRLILGVEGHDRQDGAEEFFLQAGRIGGV
jgi:hypothetical protein